MERGTAALSRLYTTSALVIKPTADRFEPASAFAAAESTLAAQPAVTLSPVSAVREGSHVIHHIFRTCAAGASCSNGYFRLEQARDDATWKIATDVWTLTPYKE